MESTYFLHAMHALQSSAEQTLTCRFIFLSVNQCSDSSLLRALRSSSRLRNASLLLCSLLSQGSIDDSDPARCMLGFFCQLAIAFSGLVSKQNVTVCRKILSSLIQITAGAIEAPSRIYPVGTDRGLPGKMVFGLAPPACMLQALLSQIKAVGPSQSGGKAQITGLKRKCEKSFGFCDHQMTSAITKDDLYLSLCEGSQGHNKPCTHAGCVGWQKLVKFSS